MVLGLEGLVLRTTTTTITSTPMLETVMGQPIRRRMVLAEAKAMRIVARALLIALVMPLSGDLLFCRRLEFGCVIFLPRIGSCEHLCCLLSPRSFFCTSPPSLDLVMIVI